MYKFEKILKDNDCKEDNSELLSASLINKIAKFRALQAKITAETSPEEKAEIETKLNNLDAEILKQFDDEFEFEDEEETEKEKQKAEAAAAKAADLKKRAIAAGLAETATEAEIKKAEKDKAAAAEKAKKDDEEEQKKPATTNAGALEKLHKAGKASVTTSELKSAGFDTSFFGSPIGPNGCTVGGYKLYRENPESDSFSLTKK